MSKTFHVLAKDGMLDIGKIFGTSDAEVTAELPSVVLDMPAARTDAEPESVSPSDGPSGYYREAALRTAQTAAILPFSDERHGAAAEQYRIIRTKILNAVQRPGLIAISSPSRGDGKTVSAINIATSLSLKEKTSVLLVDTDLRRPKIAALLGLPEAPGLAEVLSGTAKLNSTLVRTREFPNLHILPAGQARTHPAELLHSETFSALGARFREHFRVTILDTPPVALVTDYELVERVSDGVVLIVTPGHTIRSCYENAIKVIANPKLVGIVLNRVPKWCRMKAPVYDY